jgi:hypothetical protein
MRVVSARIRLNGAPVVKPAEFKQQIPALEKAVALRGGANTLAVLLRSAPGSRLTISILREVGDLSEAEAIDLVRDVILPGEVPEGREFSCLVLPGTLPAGTQIDEAFPATPRTAGLGDATQPPSPLMTASEESYFFFLDLAPGGLYVHPVKYILVGVSGAYEVQEAQWWPRINGESPESLTRDVPDPGHVIAGNHTYGWEKGIRPQLEFFACTECVLSTIWTERFIVVQGLLPDEGLFGHVVYSYAHGLTFFNAYKEAYLGDRGEVIGISEGAAAATLDVIDDIATEESPSMITVYTIGHGNVDIVWLGGVGITAQEFRNVFAAHPNVQFNFLLPSCHSGSFMNNLDSLPNVRVIGTSVAADEWGTKDWDQYGNDPADFNINDVGLEWTSSVFTAGNYILADPQLSAFLWDFSNILDVPLTSMLLYQSLRGATGDNSPLGLDVNYDLSNRLGMIAPETYDTHTPQVYKSW